MIRYIDQFYSSTNNIFRRTYFIDEFTNDDYINNKQMILDRCTKHRVNGPAVIIYHNNIPSTFKWWHRGKEYTDKVVTWIEENNFEYYKEMKEDDFNRMWFEIL